MFIGVILLTLKANCLYCNKDGVYCSDEEFRCREHLIEWQFMPDGDEYV